MKNALSTISVICFVILSEVACFTVTPSQNDIRSLSTTSLLLSSAEGFSENNVEDNDEHVTDDEDATSAAETVISPASVTMDDGGSDLTDRFKYKVHALMGTYDPEPGKDNENQSGNILGALLQFPTQYTFSVVGRNIEDEDSSSVGDIYANEVKAVIESALGETEMEMEMRVTPRGKKFTKVSVSVSVESAAMITSIYEDLGQLESTVMKF
jgi:putative lipoic acid-binding regulatory protein